MLGAITRRIVAWLRYRPRLSPASCAEFDSDPSRFTRSPWIKSLIRSPMFNEGVPSLPYDVISLSDPKKRTGRLFIKDLLRLERMIRFGSAGLYGTMGDNITRAVYHEEFARLVAELRETCPCVSLNPGGTLSVIEVQKAAASLIDAARKVAR